MNSYLFINGKEIHKIRAKDSEIVTTPLCLGNISKDWTVDNMKTGVNSLNKIPLSCISMNNQEWKVRPQFVSVNGDDPVFFPFSIKTSKSSCKKLCVPNAVQNLNVRAFNRMSRTNETRRIEWHETCKCKGWLDASVCNNKQRWNDDKCRCECKELTDKGVCDKGFIWNPSNGECECYKSCDFSEYLDYKNCKCKKKIVDKLVERGFAGECTENIDQVKITRMDLFEHENECVSSYTISVVLAVIVLTINIGIRCSFCLISLVLKKKMLLMIKNWLLRKILTIKQQSIELINEKNQRNRDQKSNLLFLRRHN